MGKLIGFLYGLVAYLFFAVTIVYAIGFVSSLMVPKTIDSGPPGRRWKRSSSICC